MASDIEFSIAESAKTKIRLLVADFQARRGKDAVPAIMWIDSKLNKDVVDSRPAIGLYDREDVADDIVIVDGLEVVLALAEHDGCHFHGKTLDYDSGRFILR